MGFRFRRWLRILPGIWINLSKWGGSPFWTSHASRWLGLILAIGVIIAAYSAIVPHLTGPAALPPPPPPIHQGAHGMMPHV